MRFGTNASPARIQWNTENHPRFQSCPVLMRFFQWHLLPQRVFPGTVRLERKNKNPSLAGRLLFRQFHPRSPSVMALHCQWSPAEAWAVLRMQFGVRGSSFLVQGQHGLEGGKEHLGTWAEWKPHTLPQLNKNLGFSDGA